MNKTIRITILFLLSIFLMQAQKGYKHSLKGVKKVVISSGARVQIFATNSNELIIGKYDHKNADHDHNHEYDLNYYNCDDEDHDHYNINEEKSEGLKAIYSNGIDNTGFGLNVEKDGDILRVKDLKSFVQRKDMKLILPKTMDISMDCGNMGSVRIFNFTSEIEVKSNIGHIYLIDVTGPVTASSNTGGIEVEFVKVNQNSPITLSTATASVDVTLPKNTNADLVLKTTMGTVYTNFDLDIKQDDDMKNLSGNRKIVTKLNEGGVKITLSSSTGNVYLRKKE